MIACGTCGTELTANAKFCDECGSPITETHAPAEYKPVTVLFADVVRSMDLASTVGAERLRDIMTEKCWESGWACRRDRCGWSGQCECVAECSRYPSDLTDEQWAVIEPLVMCEV